MMQQPPREEVLDRFQNHTLVPLATLLLMRANHSSPCQYSEGSYDVAFLELLRN